MHMNLLKFTEQMSSGAEMRSQILARCLSRQSGACDLCQRSVGDMRVTKSTPRT